MMGSPLYMSPEQMRSTRGVDMRTDIWSLGVIFYELVTGRLPFIADSVPELSAKVLLEEPVPLSTEAPHLPLELELIISRALTKKVDERYPSVAEFAVELLPYAPVRARQNVERITKLLKAAGLSKTDFHASVPPPPDADASGRLSAVSLSQSGDISSRSRNSEVHISVDTGGVPTRTEVAFGTTKGPRPGVRRGIVAGLTLLLVGATVALTMAFTGPRNSSEASAAGQPLADVAPPPKAAEPAAPVEDQPKAKQKATVAPVEGSGDEEAGSAEADAAQAAPAKPAVKAPALPRRPPVVRAPRPRPQPAQPKATAEEPPKPKSSTWDFGGRE
jgi:serine/threonine-protein kinase